MAGKLEQTKAPVDPARASVQSKSTLCTLNSIGGKSNGTTNQGCHRVLVSLFSWPGQLLSLNPCGRPKILARMPFLGIYALFCRIFGGLPFFCQLFGIYALGIYPLFVNFWGIYALFVDFWGIYALFCQFF